MDYKEKVIALLNSQELSKEQKEKLESIFPELKESEDERIRKSLIDMLKNDEKHYLKEIAWLEKQGEQKPVDKVEPKFKVGDIIRHKEQGFTCKIIAVDTEYRLSECNGTHLPFDSQDAYELVEQKPTEWSEDDQSNFNELSSFILETYRAEDASRLITWLDYLKERVQPQPNQEWSDEDEKMITAIMCSLDSAKLKRVWGKQDDDIENWLKSLRPQSQWKPDSSMIICLEYAIKHINKDGDKRILSKLLEQLKQL